MKGKSLMTRAVEAQRAGEFELWYMALSDEDQMIFHEMLRGSIGGIVKTFDLLIENIGHACRNMARVWLGEDYE